MNSSNCLEGICCKENSVLFVIIFASWNVKWAIVRTEAGRALSEVNACTGELSCTAQSHCRTTDVLCYLEINSPHSKKAKPWEWAEVIFRAKLISSAGCFLKFRALYLQRGLVCLAVFLSFFFFFSQLLMCTCITWEHCQNSELLGLSSGQFCSAFWTKLSMGYNLSSKERILMGWGFWWWYKK